MKFNLYSQGGNSQQDDDQVRNDEDVERSPYYLYSSCIEMVDLRARHKRSHWYGEDPPSPKEVNSNCGGPTPLHLAVLYEKLDMVESLLVEKKANPNMPNKKTGETVLHWITRQWDYCVTTGSIRYQIIQLLLLHGANPNKKNRLDRGTTPLCNAIRRCCNSSYTSSRSQTSIMGLLLGDGGANPNMGGSDGSPLEIAVSKYIELGWIPTTPTPSKNLEVRQRLLTEIIPMLLNHKADLNIENSNVKSQLPQKADSLFTP